MKKPNSDRLCAFLVATASRSGDPRVPDFVGVGIPSSCLSTWHTLESIDKLLSRYHIPAEKKRADPSVKDIAKPKLKPKAV